MLFRAQNAETFLLDTDSGKTWKYVPDEGFEKVKIESVDQDFIKLQVNSPVPCAHWNKQKQRIENHCDPNDPLGILKTPGGGGANPAPEGTIVNMPDGSQQIKHGGRWVPYMGK
jgi:hypothetical protein